MPTTKTDGTRKFASLPELCLRGVALRRLFAIVPVLRCVVLFRVAIVQGFNSRFQIQDFGFQFFSSNLESETLNFEPET